MKRDEEEYLAEEVFCARALEGAPSAAARPVAVYQRVVQIQHQRPHMPALEKSSSGECQRQAMLHCSLTLLSIAKIHCH